MCEWKLNSKCKNLFQIDLSAHTTSLCYCDSHTNGCSPSLYRFAANDWQLRFDIFRERTLRLELFVRAMRCVASPRQNLSTGFACGRAEAHTQKKNGAKRTVTIVIFECVERVGVWCGACIGPLLSCGPVDSNFQERKSKPKHTGSSLAHRSISLSWTSSRMDVD